MQPVGSAIACDSLRANEEQMSRPPRSSLSAAPKVPGFAWTRVFLAITLVVTNIIGAIVVFVLAALVVPLPPIADEDASQIANLIITAIYVPLAVVVGILRGVKISRRATRWLRERREPDEAERKAVLRAPARLFLMQSQLWGVAAVGYGIYNARESVHRGALIAVIVALAGVSTCAIAYLLAERVLRPLARVALSYGVPNRLGMRLGARTILAWLLGSGIFMFGILLAGITGLTLGDQVSARRLAITMVALGGTALWVGGLAILFAAKAASDPVRALRSSISRVSDGDLTASVPIYDGTEVGVLQAGFNNMLEGLQERERIRDLFGRHVGDDVARAALERGVQLGGEVREVAVLFIDIVGSTTMATNRPPTEVVTLLNRFFDIVIDVVHQHDGWINKFEGDAALAIWGAPAPLADKERAVLAAARVLRDRLADELPELQAGVGVSAGQAVAGNVGAAHRYEYTVIGDPVNEAARLTELAKSVPGMVVANACLLEAAGDEAERWVELEPVVVRGRTEPTRVARPA